MLFGNRKRFVDRRRFRLGFGLPPVKPDDPVSFALLERAGDAPRHFVAGLDATARKEAGAFVADLVEQVRAFIETDDAVVPLHRPDDLRRLFDGGVEVVTILAHSPSELDVELLSGRVTWAALGASVPAAFDGMVDLRICNAERRVADAVRVACPRAIVRAPDGCVDLFATGWPYARALGLVASRQIPYDEAARRAWVDHLASRR